jgi:hypothetical protein
MVGFRDDTGECGVAAEVKIKSSLHATDDGTFSARAAETQDADPMGCEVPTWVDRRLA